MAGFAQGQGAIDALGLLPERDWINGLDDSWDIGEVAAQDRLSPFLMMDLTAIRMAGIFRQNACVAPLTLFALGRDFAKHRLVCGARSDG